jgi:hypothetical protein
VSVFVTVSNLYTVSTSGLGYTTKAKITPAIKDKIAI